MKARVKATGTIIGLSDIGPDYWEKLKHMYAGMAMQGMMNNSFLVGEFKKDPNNGISDMSNIITKAAVIYATALVNRLKEESQCEK